MKLARTLALAIMAVLALTASVGVSAAAAKPIWLKIDSEDFVADSYPAEISGGSTSSHSFGFARGKVDCSGVTYSVPTMNGTSEKLRVTLTYKGCLWSLSPTLGKLPAEVNMKGCSYYLYAEGSADITCEGAGPIEIKSYQNNGNPLCFYKIAESYEPGWPYEGAYGEVDYDVVGKVGTEGIAANLALTGIKYSLEGTSKLLCGESGSYSVGTYTGGGMEFFANRL